MAPPKPHKPTPTAAPINAIARMFIPPQYGAHQTEIDYTLNMVIDPRELRTPARPRGATITDDRACPKCRYALKGLDHRGICPECGTPIRSAGDSDEFRDWSLFKLSPTAKLMDLDLRDMRRTANALGLMSIGMAGVNLSMLALYGLRLTQVTLQSIPATTPAAVLTLGALCGVIWMIGLAVLLWPRAGRIEPADKRLPLGAMGATKAASKISKQSGSGLMAVGEAWPIWLRGAAVLAQLCVPGAVIATIYAVLANDFNVNKTGLPALIAQGAWLVAFAAMVPAIVLVIDLSRSASDDPSLGRFLSGAWGMVIGAIVYMLATHSVPNVRGFSGLFGMLVGFVALILLPLSGMFVVGLFSLWSTCRWAPHNKIEAAERQAEKIRRDIERGNQDAAAAYFRGD